MQALSQNLKKLLLETQAESIYYNFKKKLQFCDA